ncbi:MAG TPA: acyl-CoA dehydrogenase family protein [Desulfatiglandales bacterium]|nr:acyl-CoA dehydrogenase family protein [Desulfatiglandales bacterium]
MDFRFSPDEEKFKQEVYNFFIREQEIVNEARKEWGSGLGFGPYCWEILKKIGSKGWLCPTWPKEYGGLELSYMYRYIIMEQMQYFINIYSTVGAGMAGPIILRHGGEKQKREYLPKIAKGEIEFALGYTEPDAGSDLAAISIKAEEKEDYFVINGSKLFNTRAHYAQYHWLGARTEEIDSKKKYKGISLFIIDLKTPGIAITPIWTVGGTRTNEVFYGDVYVPKEALVGEKNRGFYYILEALNYERLSTVAGRERDFQELLSYVKEKGFGKDVLTRQRLAEIAIDIESAKLFALRVAAMLDKNQIPNHEASMLKMVVAETEQSMVQTAMQIFGSYGQLRRGSKWAPLDGKFEVMYRDSVERLITRGTSEIIKNIIAQRGLGLPRG